MSHNVFANLREVSAKSSSGTSICAFPDVCFTPPQTAATPPGVPIPYPNTGRAGDTTKGSKKTKISNKEIMLRNSSHFKTSYGDEAGCATKKGFITSKNKGKVYFTSWSMDVKVEGRNVVRNLDLTTHNHASPIHNGAMTVHVSSLAIPDLLGPDCEQYVPDGVVQCQENGAEHAFECESYVCDGCVRPPTNECKERAKEANQAYNQETKEIDKQKARLEEQRKQEAARVQELAQQRDQARAVARDLATRESWTRTRREQRSQRAGAARSRATSLAESLAGAVGAEAGTFFEQWTLGVLAEAGDEIEHIGYKAHCTTCHLTAEIDVVTKDSVIEAKQSSTVVSKEQLQQRILPVTKKCFSGKNVEYFVGMETPTRPSKAVRKNLDNIKDDTKKKNLIENNIKEQTQALEDSIRTKMSSATDGLSAADKALVNFRIVPL